MIERKKIVLDLDSLRAGSTIGTVSQAMRDMQSLSTTAQQAQALLAESSAITHAERILRENSAGANVAALEIKRVEEMKKFLDPYKDIRKMLRPDASVQAMLAAVRQQDGLTARITAEHQTAQTFSKHLEHHREIAKQFDDRFRLPLAVESGRLLAGMQLGAGSVAEYCRQHRGEISVRQDLIASMSRPWLRQTEATRSVTALLELQGLGSALRSAQGFDDSLTVALRSDLGDWRDRISFPQAVLEDPTARTSFYVQRGFNTSLTDFPDEAFEESLTLFGLDADVEDVVDEWSDSMAAGDAIEEAAFRRTNKCHNCLQRLERRMRLFIDGAMTAQYGADWPKKRLSPQMLESWEHKKSRAENTGVVITLFIDVADFTDYEAIICRKDHWREVFEVQFKRKESVRESLQRLYPIRLATMHARFVTKEDELYVLAESMRLLGAIG